MNSNLSYSELISGLSNPLMNRRLLDAILVEKSNGRKINIRTLKVPGSKAPDDSEGTLSYDDVFRFESELFHYIIKKFYEAVETDRSKINQNMVPPDLLRKENVRKIMELAEAPTDFIELLRFDLFELGPLRDPFNVDERERKVYARMKRKYGLEEDLTYLLSSVYQNMVRFDEHMGRAGVGNLFLPAREPCTIRIYLNTPDGKPVLDFAREYIKKCIEHGIDYDAKFAFNSISNDRTILYANGKDICTRVKILEEIAAEHPELIEKFGTPIMDTATFNGSYFGICHAGVLSKNGNCVQTYNNYFDGLSEAAFVLMKARIMFKRLFFDKAGLLPGEFGFVGDIATLKKFASQAGSPYGRQNPMGIRYFPRFDYSDGMDGRTPTPDKVGEVFRTEGLSWKDIDRRLNDILERKPGLQEKIVEKKKSGEIDMSSEFGNSMVIIANYTQSRNLEAKSNVAISRKMEEYIPKESIR